MYQEYYVQQLYKKGYLRLNETKNKDKIPKLIQLANQYRAKDKFPSDLSMENVGLRPVHRMSIQDLTQQVDQCINTKVVADDCANEEMHPSDAKWIQDRASKKLITKKSLVRAYINLIKLKKTKRIKRRRTRPSNLTSPLKTPPTRSKKTSQESS
jgi:uncharacterized membrane protein